jgi:hypothetical protein
MLIPMTVTVGRFSMDELVEGKKVRYRHRSAQEWQQLLSAWRASGKTRETWCHEQGLSKESLRRWGKRLRAGQPDGALVRLAREPQPRPVDPPAWLRVLPDGQVEILGPLHEEVLRRVLHVVREQAHVR